MPRRGDASTTRNDQLVALRADGTPDAAPRRAPPGAPWTEPVLNEAWRSHPTGGSETSPAGVDAALLHFAAAGDQPVLVVSRPKAPAPLEATRVRWANTAAADLFGVAADHLVDLATTRLLRPRDGSPELERLSRDRRTRCAVDAVTSGGELRRTEVVAWPVPEREGWEWFWVLGVVLPEDERAQAALRAAEDRFATLAQSSPVPTIVSDVGARLSRVNDAFAELIGLPAEELCGTAWLTHVVDDERSGVVEAVARVLSGERVTLDTRLRNAAGQVRWVAVRLAPSRTPGYGAGFIGTVEDVTDRLAREHRLAYQAQHDLLTGLPNRLALLERLADLLALPGEAPGPGTDVGVLMVDLDDFKTVNDGLGPEAGDAVLVEIARRLAGTVRSGDVVARPGGDEFVLVCAGLDDLGAVEATARRVLDAVLAPVEVNGLRLRLSASIGVVLLDGSSCGPEEVVRDAGIAVHEAKAAGGGRWTLLDEDVRHRARRALRLVADLREALSRGAVDVHYQPIVRPGRPAQVLSLEALCRWTHPELGAIPPDTFIELAERANLVPALDAHVLAVACRDLATWRAAHAAGDLPLTPTHVAVNVSAVSLAAEGFAAGVRRTVAGAGLQLSDLCLEVTETALASDLRACRTVLEELRRDGARVAIDDFGTGYSSLAYLKDLPVDHLKVDRSFVRDLRTAVDGVQGGPARAVAAAVVSLARTLGLGIVAEGVETLEQDAVVRDLGCEAVQGWLYSRPLPREALAELLRGGGLLHPLPQGAGA
ncbi:diguanylate cyclase/phosphodiesterase with PAS/PAC and GAF sensor(s) [Kineococcus radiotolerans SRS30216 = ATCC BAA-149]|uniref:Diguanylate cyclase/phosphodiesterase with PAS/PAC and GAF sensor(S) n=1 Tax=Kineococcus radiotolerans (strain ATCC BAA-149 / DSM 14245 / SRS30216) TaxID=266940 RepID=A6W8B5_KINRD|nr:diguanylate cyclase/phosphodiesterase with PAS/PAC and GAF sensor(s) [Kineococcus radiotolerans SRS30216 = ATCC BAA-149]